MKNTNSFTPQNVTPSNLESVTMDISKEGSEYLIANLTNLYTHPEIAVLREYTANALDSHIKAGQTKPILVDIVEDGDNTGNSYLHKPYTLTVEDFGLGMSKDEIVNIYSQYGASTKRDSNAQIGAFGLGAKSGLAVADSFILRTRKDGKELNCIVRKNENGVGIIEFVSETDTTEPNGVKISIHVTKTNTFLNGTVINFFATWKQGSVLLNGEQPYLLDTDNEYLKVQISDHEVLGWIKTNTQRYEGYYYSGRGNGSINLGGITYNIAHADREHFRSTIPHFDKIFGVSYVNALIGSIDLTPPREGIRFSPKTIATLKAAFQNFVEFGKETVQSHINNLSRKDAILFYKKNQSLINAFWGKDPNNTVNDTATWNGESFDTTITFLNTSVNNEDNTIFYEMIYPKSAGLNRNPFQNSISALEVLSEDRFVGAGSNFVKMIMEEENLTETWFTRNIRDYSKHVYGDANICVIATNDTSSTDVWLDALAPLLDKEDMITGARAFRSSRTKTVRPVKEVSYQIFTRSTGKVVVETTSALTHKTMLYVEKKDGLFPDRLWQDLKNYRTTYSNFTASSYPEFFAVFNTIFKNFEGIVFLENKSPRPLVKLHPQMESLSELLEKQYQAMDKTDKQYAEIYANLIERHMFSLENLKNNCKNIIAGNMLTQIKDSKFRNLVNFFGTTETNQNTNNGLNHLIALNKVHNLRNTMDNTFNILEVAPLLVSNVANSEHYVIYLNSVTFTPNTKDTEIRNQPYRFYQ